jgi:hypothetical protein
MGWKRVAGIALALAVVFGSMPCTMAKGKKGGKIVEHIEAARAAMVQFDKSRDPALLQEAGEKLQGVDLLAIEGIAERQEVRSQTLIAWLEILVRVDSMIDPKFDPDDAPLTKVSPPQKPGEPAYLPGVDPKKVRDPAQRAEYLNAIEENSKKAERTQLQWNVKALDTELTESASRFIKRFHTTAPVDRKELQRIVDKAGISPQRRQAILSW